MSRGDLISSNLIKIRSFDPLPYITTKGSNKPPYMIMLSPD